MRSPSYTAPPTRGHRAAAVPAAAARLADAVPEAPVVPEPIVDREAPAHPVAPAVPEAPAGTATAPAMESAVAPVTLEGITR
ncbi:hypothetical protein ACJ6WF_03715 [Streptomyces sp. MMS24-I2-30]|uniref:hypothetical protein n=1 Tax=Streptomyces sp. MMS24-I2-30 TaxID=3351564 RepID=UPI003896B445